MAASQLRRVWNAFAFAAFSVLCLLGVVVFDAALTQFRERAILRQSTHALKISDTLRDALGHMENAETARSEYLRTGSQHAVASFHQERNIALQDLSALQRLTRGDAERRRRAARLLSLANGRLSEIPQAMDSGRSGRAIQIMNSGRDQGNMGSIRNEILQMQEMKSRLLSTQADFQERILRESLSTVIGVVAFLVAVLAAMSWSIASLIRRQVQSEARTRNDNTILAFQNGELERANAKLAALANSDGLTGLANHRAFMNRLAEEVSRAARHDLPLSMVILDIDHFKLYNDEYGHPAGDAVLKTISKILQESARVCDLTARVGGEEFALILPQTDLDGASQFAERLRTSIAGRSWPVRAMTASFGVGALGLDDDNVSELLRRADEALQQSKAAGRNCVSGASIAGMPARRPSKPVRGEARVK